MKRIVLLAFAFGSVSNYFALWLETVSANSSIDFVFITDVDLSAYRLPPNLTVRQMTRTAFAGRLSECLNREIPDSAPYKFCDYRAFFGKAFPEMVAGYDFWGTVDWDVILGDLRLFLTDDILSGKYNRIYTRDHLTLYPVGSKLPELLMSHTYTDLLDLDEVASSRYVFGFSEWGSGRGASAIFQRGGGEAV